MGETDGGLFIGNTRLESGRAEQGGEIVGGGRGTIIMAVHA